MSPRPASQPEKAPPPKAPCQSLVAFLRSLDLAELDLIRERDTGRDIAF
jgi:hypothetical protein